MTSTPPNRGKKVQRSFSTITDAWRQLMAFEITDPESENLLRDNEFDVTVEAQ